MDLGLDRYMKPLMCNVGVGLAKNAKIVLLDSDRILPYSYFSRAAEELDAGTVITTKRLYNLDREYSDWEIENDAVVKTEDFRTEDNEIRRKNMFAGNTLMMKDDYYVCGGMDESYTGYGFADTDMTERAMTAGLDLVFLNEEELHLWHPKTIFWEGQELTQPEFQILSAINATKYMLKWDRKPDKAFKKLILEVTPRLNTFPDTLQGELVRSLGELGVLLE